MNKRKVSLIALFIIATTFVACTRSASKPSFDESLVSSIAIKLETISAFETQKALPTETPVPSATPTTQQLATQAVTPTPTPTTTPPSYMPAPLEDLLVDDPHYQVGMWVYLNGVQSPKFDGGKPFVRPDEWLTRLDLFETIYKTLDLKAEESQSLFKDPEMTAEMSQIVEAVFRHLGEYPREFWCNKGRNYFCPEQEVALWEEIRLVRLFFPEYRGGLINFFTDEPKVSYAPPTAPPGCPEVTGHYMPKDYPQSCPIRRDWHWSALMGIVKWYAETENAPSALPDRIIESIYN